MGKYFLLLLIFITTILNADKSLFTSEEQNYIKKNEIKIAVLPDFHPFNIYEDNEFSGLSNDILSIFSKKYGLKFKFEVDNWPNNLKKFEEKKVDVIDTISYKKERVKFTNYTEPYYEIPLVIFSRKDIPNIKNIEELKGKTLGITTNIFYEDEIRATNLFKIKTYDNLTDKIKALAFGEIDIIFGHLNSTQVQIINQGFTNIKALSEVNLPTIKKTDLRYGINKENQILTSIFNKALQNITTLEWENIYGKWITEVKIEKKQNFSKKLNLTDEEKRYILNKKYIKVQNEQNWPPYNFNDNGKPKGFSIDYTNLIAKKLNLEVKYIQGYTWDEYMDMLKNHQIDIINNISKNKKREEFIDFTDIFHTAANAIYVKKGNEFIDSLEKLAGKTIIMPKGFFAQQLIEKHYPEIKQILVKDSLEALKLLSLGKADATIGKKNVLDYIISTNNISGVIATNYVDDNRLVSLIRMGVPKGETHLQSILQKAQDIVTDEELLQLKRKWFGDQTINTNKDSLKLTNIEKSYLEKKKEIKYCINTDLTPIDFLDQNGNHNGISNDFIKIFSKNLNIKFEFVKTRSFEQSLQFLKEKRCDLITSIENNEILDNKITTTYPYLNYKLAIITRKNIPVVQSLEDILDKTIALKSNSQLISALKSNNPDITISKTPDELRALIAVNKSDAYFTLAPLPIASFYISEYALNDLYISRYTNIPYTINMGVRDDEPLLLDIMNKVIKGVSDNQKRTVLNKWSKFNIQEKFDYELFWKILIIVLIILGILIYRQAVLNKHNYELKQVNNEIEKLKKNLEKRVEEEVSKNEQKTKQLVEQSRLAQMGELINMIAHQWRQPLTAISATISNISFKLALNDEINKQELENELLLLNEYAQHLSSTIDDFRNFYKKDKIKKSVTIENIIEQALSIIKPSLISNSINIQIEYNSHYTLKTYPTEINHVILNILKNAEDILLEESIENPKIIIKTFNTDKHVCVNIIDNGNGIKEDIINKIFEPYFSTKIEKHGTGLGLYMSKVIIEEHCRGKLNVENLENGVLFKIRIPKE